jgi:DNA polymerase I-like protein with 3'-5' exonuclease and polymerase domains
MNSLFAGFDLTVEPTQTVVTETTVTTETTIKSSKVVTVKNNPAITNQSLFANAELEEFNIELNKPKPEALAKKVTKPEEKETDPTKILKSKKVSLAEKLALIKVKVLEVLGKQKKNVIVIKDKVTFEDYVSKAIEFGRIAIDTETNNSTDPMTCQLMGLCLYYEGGKQAYIPVNHVNPETGERLEWQLTEEDCREQLQRIKDAGTFVVMHNGKFDYEVIKCTCDIEIEPDWDTMIGAHTINENERMGLKPQYISKIDPTQEKYDIDHLFTVPYKYVDPEIFALYAATDSMMTDKLYVYQVAILEAPGNERLYWLFKNIEMPIVKVAGDIELIGVCIDQEFGERLKIKFNKTLEDIDQKIDQEMINLQPTINAWKLSGAANERTKQFEPKKSKMSLAKLEEKYPYIDKKTGKRYKVGKALIEQLGDPINLASPTQLAILFYDILKCPVVSKKSPRGTGKDELEAIAEKTDITLCKLILERRGIVKLISTYIDVIPALAQHWPDGRIRYKLNSVGTDTGRFSSGGEFKFLDGDTPMEISGINSQNIPSRGDGKITRMLFTAKKEFDEIEVEVDQLTLPEVSEIETVEGLKYGKDLKLLDQIITDEGVVLLEHIAYKANEREYELTVRRP